MNWSHVAPVVLRSLGSRQGVAASEYAVLAVGLVALIAAGASLVASWVGPLLGRITGAV